MYSNSTKERNVYFLEMACEYDTSDNAEAREKARTCSRTVSDTKTAMNEAAERVGSEVRQIYQSPTCNSDDKPFQERWVTFSFGVLSLISMGQVNSELPSDPSFSCRYFGHIYPRLLKIKNYWDPENVIHHCQSVGSTEQNCCIEEE